MTTKTALLFAGQGAQCVGMGSDLADQFPAARQLFEQANALLGCDLASICFRGPETELTKTEYAQPGIYLTSWAAFQVLKQSVPAFEFQAAAGLSLGEFTALAAAGALPFEAGLEVVRQRGQLMQEACDRSAGAMAAIIGLDETPLREVCESAGVELANLNCPGQLVISGSRDGIARACELAKAKGAKRALPLAVAGAYHSKLMAPAQPGLREALARIQLKTPNVPILSNVTGRVHGEPAAIAEALVQQVTASVRWEDCIRTLLADGFTRFIELGPGTALGGFMKRIDKSATVLNVADCPSLENTVRSLSA